MIEAIVLSNQVLDTVDSWQQAIDASGYGLQLTTPIPIESLDGYVPVRWRKNDTDRNLHKSGFECRHRSAVSTLSEGGFEQPETPYSCAFVLGWADDPLAKISVRVAAAAYAAATSGIVLLRNKGHHSPDQVLQMVRSTDEYEWLPRRQASAPTTPDVHDFHRYNERPKTIIQNVDGTKLHDLKKSEYAVLVGRNNSGKSFVLKALTEHWGKSASYLGPARYQKLQSVDALHPSRRKARAEVEAIYRPMVQ